MASGSSSAHIGGVDGTVVVARLFGVVNEMATRAVRTEADTVECTTEFGFILGMTLQVAQFMHSVGKLAFLAVFAFAGFLKRAT